MLRYTVRRLLTLLVTMLIVSIVVFAVAEIAPGNVARNILGAYATPEQEKSMAQQLGLSRPTVIRYVSWLAGTDWQTGPKVGRPLKTILVSQGTVANYRQWWAVDTDASLVQWTTENGDLVKLVRQPDGTVKKVPDPNACWHSWWQCPWAFCWACLPA
jgi:peptide/nickel transport system permease protein